jgi:hypothetical protein
MIRLPDTPETRSALTHMVSSISPEAAKAIQFLIDIRLREINANLHKAAVAALYDETAKATALRLVGEQQAYLDIKDFINKQKV